MAVLMLLILHENIVADLCILAAGASRTAVRAAVRNVSNIEHLAVRTAGTIFQTPPVIVCTEIVDILRLESGSDSELCAFLISGSILIACENRSCEMIPVESENVSKELVTPLASFFLKIITKAPAAHHLKECNVASVTY